MATRITMEILLDVPGDLSDTELEAFAKKALEDVSRENDFTPKEMQHIIAVTAKVDNPVAVRP